MPSFATLIANLQLNISNFSQGLRQASQQATRFARGLNRTIGDLTTVTEEAGFNFKDVGRIVQGIVISQVFYQGLQAIKDCAKSLWDFNQELEYTTMSMSIMMGNLDLAQEFTRVLKEFAAVTPFDFTQAAQSAKELLSYGIEYKNLMFMMRGIMSAATIKGDPQAMKSITKALGQIYTKGRLQQQEMLQLTEAGIPAFEILGEKLGLTQAQLGEIGKQGISASKAINALVEGMTERYGAVLDYASMTMSGIINNIKDNFVMVGSEVIKPFFYNVKKWLGELNTSLQQMNQVVQKFGVGGLFEYLCPPWAQEAIRQLVVNIHELRIAIQNLAVSLGPVIQSAVTAFINTLNWCIPPIYAIVNGLSLILDNTIGTAGGINTLTAVLTVGFKAWVIYKAAMLAAATASAVIKGLSTIASWISAISKLLLASPWMLFLLLGGIAIGGLIVKFTGLGQKIKDVFSSISNLFNKNTSNVLQKTLNDTTADADKFSEALDGTKDSIEDVDKAAKKAAKAAAGLLSFDEVFRLKNPDEGTGAGINVDDLADQLGSIEPIDMGDFLTFDPAAWGSDFKEKLGARLKELFGSDWFRDIIDTILGAGLGGIVGYILGGPVGAILGVLAGALVGYLWDRVSDSLNMTPTEHLSSLIGAGLGAAIGGIIGGPVGAMLGGIIGALCGWVIGAIIDGITTGEWDYSALGTGIGAAIGAAIGLMIGGPGGALIGAAIGAMIGDLCGLIIEGIKTSNWDLAAMAKELGLVIATAVGLIIAGPAGGLIGAAIALLVTWVFEEITKRINEGKDGFAPDTAAALGGAVGAAIGLCMGGPVGALIGGAIGALVGWIYEKISEKIGQSDWQGAGSLIAGGIGGAIGFAVGGPGGAVIGAAIGLLVGHIIGTIKDMIDGNAEWTELSIPLGTGIGAAIGFIAGGPAGAAIGAGIGAFVGWLVNKFAAVIKGEANWTTLATPIGAGLGGAIGFIVGGPVGAAIGAAIGALVGWIVKKFGEADWSKVGDAFIKPFEQFGKRISQYWHMIWDPIKKAFDDGDWLSLGANIVLGIVEGIVGAITFIVDAVITFFDAVISAFCEIFGIHSPATETEFIGENIILGILGGFGKAFGQLISWIGTKASEIIGAFANWCTSTASNVATWASNTASSIGTWCTDTWSNFTNWVSNTASTIGDWCTNRKNDFTNWCSEVGTKFSTWKDNVVTTVTTWASDTKSKVSDWITNRKTDFENWKTSVGTTFTNWKNNVVSTVSTWASDTKSKVTTWVSDRQTQFSNWKENVGTTFTNWKNNVVSTVSTWASDTKSKVTDWITNRKNDFSNWKTSVGTTFTQWKTNTVSTLSSWVSDTKSKVTTWISQRTSDFTGFINDIKGKFSLSNFTSLGSNILQGIANGIKNSLSFLTEAAKSIYDTIVDKVKKLFGISSPAKEMEPLGKFITAGLGVGMSDGVDTVTDAVANIATLISDGFSGISDAVSVSLTETSDTISDFATGQSGSLGAWAEGLHNSVKDALKGASEQIEGFNPDMTFGQLAFAGVNTSSVDVPRRVEPERKGVDENERQATADANAKAIAEYLMPVLVDRDTGGGNNDDKPILYVGTLIADDEGLKQLERRMKVIRTKEERRGN